MDLASLPQDQVIRRHIVASALLELRKRAGFRNAKDFAAAEGIAEATYARYESSPEKIPLKSAWQLADRFGVSIDVIVGREHVDVSDMRGEVQDAYDALSEQSQASARDYLAFLAQRDARNARERETEERRRYDALCYRLEQVFLAQLEEGDPNLFAFGAGEKLREALRAYLEKRADERQEPEVRTSVEQIMAAYDRAHGPLRYGDWTIEYAVTDLRNPRVRAEYEGAPARKGANGKQ